MKGMIVFAFAWRKGEDSPCNIRLALAAKRIAEGQDGKVVIHAQRSVAKILRDMGVECYATKRNDAIGYEGSEEPVRQAAELFRDTGITEVIPVANPVLHLIKCISLVMAEGFKTPSFLKLVRMIGWIGFDKKSVQPQTWSLFWLVYYTAKQILFGYRPPLEQSEP